MGGGVGLGLLGLCLLTALLSYDPADPSLNNATAAAPNNWLGTMGASLADLAYQIFGLGIWFVVIPVLCWAFRALRRLPLVNLRRSVILAFCGAIVLSLACGWVPAWPTWPVDAGVGGVVGYLGVKGITALMGLWGWQPLGWAFCVPLLIIGLVLFAFSLGLEGSDWGRLKALFQRRERYVPPYELEEEEPKPQSIKREVRVAPEFTVPAQEEPAPARLRDRVKPPKEKAAPIEKATRQGDLKLGDKYESPSLELLAPVVKSDSKGFDRSALEQNARLLESVLDDYGVKGQIIQVRPGPVVTMYELEPAPGIKSSRVIGLADDIARSMSAISARVAVVPGRNVIGIELPNAKRDTVYLRELLMSESFTTDKKTLPMVLGKDIAGDAVVADLAPMPHLLIAGTTGSGKSVGLNAMIVSLLYRMGPDRLRFIMIDPKMLELSVYDGIPHLLAPVVTEPKKAIAALKWAVREMDDRYRKMASVNARSLAGFNEKVMESKARGQSLVRRVHTGYDRESGQPIYEEQTFDFDPLPLIIVVVDELADLMMVAGKEVEILIQRLAQKARAAGIHLIMATQRPSVDVITGVIKANLPTRISFSVTSKIDSRTILGEQGAEQLLGKGDMLYMAGGKQIIRVHGPFVTEEEVERVADHWRSQGMPDYVEAVTEEPEESEDGSFDAEGGEDGGEGDMYRRAVQIVAESQKASTSYLQRQLRIGYNSAARLIERMEKEGLVGQPDHVGRREVFLDRDGTRL
ncbi:DNA translocase FtsK 4TM domain-containing protein [Sphingosinicellaceae bacterium A1X5R2]|nr:DNA translocase FtsK 4TM domain-containing protein [Pedomonas mirosovicensis]MCH8684128.1 DNA translocase FtsK 4TM domain-containing protein [Pedomonas mirosovicensis]